MKKHAFFLLGAAALASACGDVPTSSAPVSEQPSLVAASRGGGSEKFVAIGTSISMGWQSNGVYANGQLTSWPALLGFGTGRPISLPLIQSPGCTSPLVAPLGAGVRLSGEPLSGSTVCAPNVPGVTLPAQNVGIAGAITIDALTKTPETGATAAPWYNRVLPAGATQVSAALGQQPSVISVELGGNDILGVTSGLVAPGVTFVPFQFFAAAYDAVLNAIGSANAKVVLFAMPSDGTKLPALRRGDEIWADRAEFAALHVDVSPDCDGSQNYINVSIKSLNVVFTAAFTSTHGLPNPVFSCADVPGAPDLVLTPNDIAFLNGMLAQMQAHVREQASARGYAYASLGALYDRSLKPATYSVVSQLTSRRPYGLFVSLDGVHPTVFGHVLLAVEAARALNAQYGARFARTESAASLRAEDNGAEEMLSASQALELARGVARANRGMQLPPCSIPGGCRVGAFKLR